MSERTSVRMRVNPAVAAVMRYASAGGAAEVELADNTNRWGSPPAAMAALEAMTAAGGGLADYPSLYGEALKDAVAARHAVSADAVVTGCGSDNILAATLLALGGARATVAHPDPTFVMVKVFAQLQGVVPRPVPLGADGRIDPDAMLAADADITYLCTPNNPTGALMSDDAVRHVVARARGVVVVDEAYAEFTGSAGLLAAAPAMERVVVMRTMSKAWGLAGARAGYATAAPALVEAIEKARGPYTLSAVAERAAVAALTTDDSWMRATVAEAVAVRARLADALRAMGLAPLDSAANFLLVPMPDARTVQGALLARGVRVRAFAGLPGVGDALRVTVAPWAQCVRFLEALAEVRA